MAALGSMSGMEGASQRFRRWAGRDLWLKARVAGLGVWMDTEQRSGVRSWPGTTQGSEKTQLGPCPQPLPSGCWSGSGQLTLQAEGESGTHLGALPQVPAGLGSDPGSAASWL